MVKEGIGPYRFVDQMELSSAIVEKLGTDEYIDWQFEDTSIKDADSPVRHVRLTVTYYTGGRDQVPHTPDVCMVGAGYKAQEAENLDLDLPNLGAKVPVRVLTFEPSMLRQRKPTVAYTFHCNGDFVCTRMDVRVRMNSLTDQHAYFAKIEVVFGGDVMAPREEAVAATQKFLDHLLPVLVRDHLPDWEAVKRSEVAGEDVDAAGEGAEA